MVTVPRLVVAGTHSGVGKTSVTLGLMAALKKRGLIVQGFKVGPDYIDTGHHTAVTGRPARNLDPWLMSPKQAIGSFVRASTGADIAIVEGVMGLFDGGGSSGKESSTAQIADLIRAPIVLVVDAAGSARSIGALVHGFNTFDEACSLGGVIFNRVGSLGHYQLVKEAVEKEAGVRSLGCLSPRETIRIPERQLGLAAQVGGGLYQELGCMMEDGLDLDGLLALAASAPSLPKAPPLPKGSRRVSLAVAKDQVFCCYYQDNLDLLESQGAQIEYFSPLHDKGLPPRAEGLYIGGGRLELHGEDLSANRAMHEAISQAAAQGMPIYAEDGGLVYLCRKMMGTDGKDYPGVGLIPARACFGEKLAALGYVEPVARRDSLLLRQGQRVRGHEFRYSYLVPEEDPFPYAYDLPGGRTEGYVHGKLLASQIHIHFAHNPQLAANFLAACRGLE